MSVRLSVTPALFVLLFRVHNRVDVERVSLMGYGFKIGGQPVKTEVQGISGTLTPDSVEVGSLGEFKEEKDNFLKNLGNEGEGDFHSTCLSPFLYKWL